MRMVVEKSRGGDSWNSDYVTGWRLKKNGEKSLVKAVNNYEKQEEDWKNIEYMYDSAKYSSSLSRERLNQTKNRSWKEFL